MYQARAVLSRLLRTIPDPANTTETLATTITGVKLRAQLLHESSAPSARDAGWGRAIARRGHTEVPPYQAFERIDGGVDRRVRPGQRLPMQKSEAHPTVRWTLTGPLGAAIIWLLRVLCVARLCHA